MLELMLLVVKTYRRSKFYLVMKLCFVDHRINCWRSVITVQWSTRNYLFYLASRCFSNFEFKYWYLFRFVFNIAVIPNIKCYCWVSCAAVFSFEHAQRWPFANRDHEGHQVQTSVNFSLLGFHGVLSLYGSFSCVLPRPTCVLFLRNCEFSHSTSW